MINIEKIKNEDINDIVQIEQASFPDPWPRNFFASELAGSLDFSFVLKYNNRIIGYIICQIIHPDASILNFAIHPEHRHQGYGSLLLKFLLNNLIEKEIVNIFLEVRKSNLTALKLYEKAGFMVISERKKYYSNKEDALIMLFQNFHR